MSSAPLRRRVMNIPVPDWVSFEADKTGGLDLLGLRAPVEVLGNRLFDGVTTVTPRLRYMSLICWIIWRYAQAKLPDERSSFFDFAALQESAFVMANRSRSRLVTKLVGSVEADRELDRGRKTLALKRLTKNIAFNIYVASSRQLNLTKPTKSGLNKLSSQRGEALAKEFDKVIRNSSYGSRVSRNPRIKNISREHLGKLAVPLAVEALPRAERDILIDTVLPAEPVDAAEQRRLRNYALLLWLARTKNGSLEENTIFELAQRPPEEMPSCLAPSADGWLAYLSRDCLAVCHEAVLGSVMHQVDRDEARRNAPALVDEVIATLVTPSREKEDALRDFRILKPGKTLGEFTFRAAFERVAQRCSKGRAVTGGLSRWSGGLSETALYQHAELSDEAAVSLLPIAWCLALQRAPQEPGEKSQAHELSRIGGIFQIGIADVIAPKVMQYLGQERSYRDVMAELVMRTVQQHLRVTWKRFSAPRGKDVSVLIADAEAWSRNNGFRAGRIASRLNVAIDWLGQLGLTSTSGLTRLGDRMLERSLNALNRS